MIAVFPGSERLRYLIPSPSRQRPIAYLRGIAQSHPGGVVVFGDDGEKFGAWPGHATTRLSREVAHAVLRSAGGQLRLAARHHVGRERRTTSLAAGQHLSSRRQLSRNDRVGVAGRTGVESDRLPLVDSVPRAAWRNFRVKYPEIDEMYARMLGISHRLQRAVKAGGGATCWKPLGKNSIAASATTLTGMARSAESTCPTCAGGLSAFDRGRQSARPGRGSRGPWVEATIQDLNVDVHKEVMLANDKLVALVVSVRRRTRFMNSTCATLPQPAGHDGPPAGNISCGGCANGTSIKYQQQQRSGRKRSPHAVRLACAQELWSIIFSTATGRWPMCRGPGQRAGRFCRWPLREPGCGRTRNESACSFPDKEKRRDGR